jgi:hypothetical protein
MLNDGFDTCSVVEEVNHEKLFILRIFTEGILSLNVDI